MIHRRKIQARSTNKDSDGVPAKPARLQLNRGASSCCYRWAGRTEQKIAHSRRFGRVALQKYISSRHGWALLKCHLAQSNQCWALSRSLDELRIGWTGSKIEVQSFETGWSRNDPAVILTNLVSTFPCSKQMILASGKRLLESFHWYWAAHSLG